MRANSPRRALALARRPWIRRARRRTLGVGRRSRCCFAHVWPLRLVVVRLRAEPDGRTGRRVAPDRPAVLLAAPGPPGEPGGPDACAGQTGLEPATCGFGDRCATNCATALRRPGLHDASRATPTDTTRRGSVQLPGVRPGHGSSWRTSTAGGPLYATSARWVEPSARGSRAVTRRRVTHRYRLARARRDLCHYGARERADPSPRPRVSARLAAIAESATLAVDAKAKALKAAGRPVIGFGAGEPDFPTPGYIVDAAVAAAKDPVNHRYTPAAGLPALREADRRQDAARLRLRGQAVAACWSPTAASRRSTSRSRRSWTRATRCCCPRRTGPPTPRRSGSRAACPSRCSPASTRATW